MRTFFKTCIFLAILTCSFDVAAEQSVRIAVGRFQGQVVIKGKDITVQPMDLPAFKVKKGLQCTPAKEGFRCGGKLLLTDKLRVTSKERLFLNNHEYRRELELISREHKNKPEVLVVHPLPLEEYLVGIVSSEVPSSWPMEALKAQAIAARTFALWKKYQRIDLPYHMESSVLDQVYSGADHEYDTARQAVRKTYGEILTHHHRPIHAYFHSTCGNHTESAQEGWGMQLSYLPGSNCGHCNNSNRHQWAAEFPKSKINQAFKKILGEPVRHMKIVSRSKTGRMKKVAISGKTKKKVITGVDIRRLLGYSQLKSTLVTEMSKTKSGFAFKGRGSGHGVGMCQWGAKGMADKGHSAEQILVHYYPRTNVRRMY
jgi:stage II sporulation protein D